VCHHCSYVPTLQPAASKWSVDMPETEEAISDELHRQEAQLAQLHQELARHAGRYERGGEEIGIPGWAVLRTLDGNGRGIYWVFVLVVVKLPG